MPNLIEGVEMSIKTFYIKSGVLIKTSCYFIYYWAYLDSQLVKSVKWKRNVEKFWLKSYLSTSFTFWTFLLTVFNFRKFGIARITICRTKQLGPQGANYFLTFLMECHYDHQNRQELVWPSGLGGQQHTVTIILI